MFKILFAILMTSVVGSVEDCSSTYSLFKIESLDFTPSSPLAGDNTTLTVAFNNPGYVVNGGSATTSLTYNYIPFNPTVEPLCQNTACPVANGSTQQSSSSAWPDISGYIEITITWTDELGNQLLCMRIKDSTMESN